MTNKFMTAAEAAEYLGVNASRVRQLLLAGTLTGRKNPPHEQRGTWYVDVLSVYQYAAKRRKARDK